MSDVALATTNSILTLALAVAGVVMAFWPPGTNRAKGAWVTGFIVVGLLAVWLTWIQGKRAEAAGKEAATQQARAAQSQERMIAAQESQGATQRELVAAQERGAEAQLRAAELLNELTRKGLRVAVSGQAVVSPELLEERKKNRSVVAGFLTDGDAIKLECHSLQENPQLRTKAHSWANAAMKALGRIDPGYPAMFNNPSGPTYSRTTGGQPIPKINEDVWNWVNLRTEALNRILEGMPR